MTEDLAYAWRLLTLTVEEKDMVEPSSLQDSFSLVEYQGWFVAKLITERPFHKNAMFTMLRGVWMISKPFEVAVMYSN